MIAVTGLSPAWQQILTFNPLQLGTVNRAASATWCASGKVLNVAAGIAALGGSATTVCPIGGWTGTAIRDEFTARNINVVWQTIASTTRVCTTVLDEPSETTTELVENANRLTDTELDEYLKLVQTKTAAAKISVLTGSFPPGTRPGFASELLDRLPGDLVLDTRGHDLLQGLQRRPLVIKPNRDELGWTVGRTLVDEDDLWAAMAELQQRGAQWIIVSQGVGQLLALGPSARHRFQPPTVKTVNPIGCGDSLTAGIAAGLDRGASMPQAIIMGMAAAARNAAELLPCRFTLSAMEQLSHQVIEIA